MVSTSRLYSPEARAPKVPHFANVEGFVLAGGRSSRMGRDKALLEIGGQTLLARAVELLQSIAVRVSIIGDRERYRSFGVPTNPDRVPDSGPVGGIVTALAHSKSEWSLVIGCDMPYISAAFLKSLCDRAENAPSGIQGVVPESSRGLEPLCAVYRKSAAPAFESALAERKLKLTTVVASVLLDRVIDKDWRPFALHGDLFQSLNCPEDLTAAKRALESS